MINKIRVADEVWLVTALLHQQHPDRPDFSIDEIMTKAANANVTGVKPLRPGVQVHVYLHCIANKPPNPGRYRMLFETANRRRRLYRPGDPCHPKRTTGKDIPKRDQIPKRYRELIDWYLAEYASRGNESGADPILLLRGVGRAIWADENADAYVQRQRAGWR